MPYCPDSMPGRAPENRIFTVTANRTGKDIRDGKEMYFIGQSEIVTPSAQILHRAPEGAEELFITEINPAEALDKNLNKQNHVFGDRRPEFYRIT
jgi:predicted amidohydrolase